MLTIFFLEQDSPLGFTGIEKLRDKLLMVFENLHKEKEEERVIVDIWCHLGHAYITKVDEGEIHKRCVILCILQFLWTAVCRYFDGCITCRIICIVKRTIT